jgi:hypothetical protein
MADYVAWAVLILASAGAAGYLAYRSSKLFRLAGDFILAIIVLAFFWN